MVYLVLKVILDLGVLCRGQDVMAGIFVMELVIKLHTDTQWTRPYYSRHRIRQTTAKKFVTFNCIAVCCYGCQYFSDSTSFTGLLLSTERASALPSAGVRNDSQQNISL